MHFDTNILLKALPALLLLAGIEWMVLVKEKHHAKPKGQELGSLWLGLGFLILSPVTKSVNLFAYSIAYEYRIWSLPDNLWLTFIPGFLAEDFTYYWFHRLSHQVRFLWASHMVHHSGEHFSYTVAFRQPWTGHLSGTFIFWMWMPLVGFSPAMVLFLKSINVMYQFSLHTETIKRLPRWVEFIFNTPSHHRVHHGSDREYIDKNHGGTLMIWDRIFGTYQDEIRKPTYGLTKNIPSQNPFVITFFEWKRLFADLRHSRSFGDYISYLFRPPGWSKPVSAVSARCQPHVAHPGVQAEGKKNTCKTCTLRGSCAHSAAVQKHSKENNGTAIRNTANDPGIMPQEQPAPMALQTGNERSV
ncbi:sterol desaturase family protein [Agriterribacter sp.]|uniref:sterol desaturase family protein n=1 Tax=Agriterribacter sp. TaxID=2821509 RepID=UPI002B8D79EF|nr:sterol desaturase family protein [Agriterribacter sp.]HRO48277.1 sterol desaturase family protein [Agriterribacter sp.]HRQ18472.1 sterol desaturase family protein [Agriterribacter sp.]